MRHLAIRVQTSVRPGNRARLSAHGLAQMCDRAGPPCRSPHSQRHGHAVYALQKCATVSDLKAVSQNLMHESLVTTDSIYSVLGGATVGARIAALGDDDEKVVNRPAPDETESELAEQLKVMLERLHGDHEYL